MPHPAYMRLTLNEKPLPSPITVCGEENLFEILEAHHSISSEEKYQFSRFLNSTILHRPFSVITEINSTLPQLFKLHKYADSDRLDSVEVFWIKHHSETGKEEIYFKHTMNPVKVCGITLFYPNIKERDFEKYNHLAEISFRYRYITMLFTKGYRIAGKYEWRYWLSEFGYHGDMSLNEADEIANMPAATDEAAAWLDNYNREKAAKLNKKPVNKLTIQVGLNGVMINQAPYKLLSEGKEIFSGNTDDEGWIDCEIQQDIKQVLLKMEGHNIECEIEIEVSV